MATANTDFDTKAAALTRRRKMAELLQAEAMKPITGAPIQGRTSFLEPLGAMAKAFAGMRMGGNIDTEEAANEAARNEAINKLIAKRPMGTPGTPEIPAVPGAPAVPGETRPPSPMLGETPMLPDILSQQAPTPPLSELGPQPLPSLLPAQPATPGKPAIPAVPAKRPSTDEMLPWVAELGAIGGRGKDLAKAFETRLAANMLPEEMTPFQIQTLAQQKEQKDADREEKRIQNMAELARKEEALKLQLQDKQLDRESRERMNQALLDIRREIGASRSSGEKSQGYEQMNEVSLVTGRGLVKGKDGRLHERLPTGEIDPTPYGGETMGKVEYAKQLREMSKAAGGSAMFEDLANDVANSKDAFTTKAKWDTNPVANFFGVGRDLSGMTPEQSRFRTQVFTVTTDLKHTMYGAALTEPEQREAAKWAVTDNDSWLQVQDKLRGRAAFEARKLAGMSEGDKAQLRARGRVLPGDKPGGGGSAPTAGAAPTGDAATDAALARYRTPPRK